MLIMKYKINIVFEKDEHGYYVYAPELPGCHSQGATFEEAMTNIREAIELYLESVPREEIEELVSKEIFTATLEVRVA
jgi:predicted RNase H-like HicB family nuclease